MLDSSSLRVRMAAGLVAALGLCVTIVSISQSRGQSQNLGQAATFGRTTLQEPEPQVPQAPKQPRILGYNVVAEFPHDKHAFTQGIQYDRECDETGQNCKDIFWESAGLYGVSTIRKVALESGEVLQKEKLPDHFFAEGLTRLGDYLYQLVWQRGTIFKWQIKQGTIHLVGEMEGPLKDGWGLTTDGKQLIATDSSATVFFIDPETLKVVRELKVTDGGEEVKWLNELEVIDGELWANVWQTECIARVNMTTGEVTHWLLLHGLKHGLHQRNPQHYEMDVLNGIAYDAEGKRLFVTGKKWPRVFQIAQAKRPATKTLETVRAECHAHKRLSAFL